MVSFCLDYRWWPSSRSMRYWCPETILFLAHRVIALSHGECVIHLVIVCKGPRRAHLSRIDMHLFN